MDLKDLYRDVIVDHNRHPRNFREMPHADRRADGYNPLCGDKLTVYVRLDGDRIGDVSFDGSGCAISVASASLLTESRQGQDRRRGRSSCSQHDARSCSPARTPTSTSRASASWRRCPACASFRRA